MGVFLEKKIKIFAYDGEGRQRGQDREVLGFLALGTDVMRSWRKTVAERA